MRMSHRRGLSALATLALIAGSVAIATPAHAAAWNPDPIIAPTNGAELTTKQVTLSWNPRAGTSQYRVNWRPAQSGASGTTVMTSGTSTTITVPADGYYSWEVGYQFFGNWNYSSQPLFRVDTTGPVVTLRIDGCTPVTACGYMTLSGSVTDFSVIASSRMYLDGNDIGSFVATGTMIPTAGLTPGTHTLRVDATDSLGHPGTQSITFEVPSAPWPADPLITPTFGQVLGSRDGVALTWTPKQAALGYRVNLGYPAAPSWSETWTDAATTSTTINGLPVDGIYTWSVDYRSETLAMVSSPPRIFTVDTVDPIVSLITDALAPVFAGTPVKLTGTITDLTSTTGRVFLDGVDIASFSPMGTSIATTGLTAGTHTLRVDATDAAGHSGTGSVTFQIKGLWAPDPIISPANGANIWFPYARFEWQAHPGSSSYRLSYQPVGGSVVQQNLFFTTRDVFLADGTYSWWVSYFESGNYVDSPSRTFTLDTHAPVVTLATNVPAPIAPGTPVVLTGSVTDLTATTARVFLDGIDVAAFDPAGTSIATTGLTTGTHTLRVDATDAVARVGSQSVTFVVDANAPVVTEIAPADGSRVGVVGLSYSAKVSENATWALSVDGGAAITGSTAGGASLTLPIASGSWINGSTHTFRLTTRDSAGNSSTASTSVVVDADAPELTIDGPVSGALVVDALDAHGTVDDESGIRSVNLEFHQKSGGSCDASVIWSHGVDLEGDSWQGTVPTPEIDGDYCVKVVATDGVGNVSHADTFVTVDRTAPTAFLVVSPRDWAGRATFTWAPATDLHGPVTYTLFVHDAYDDTWNWLPYSASTATTLTIDLNPSTYDWYVEARDAAGNVMPSDYRTVKIFGVPHLEQPDADQLFSDELEVQWSDSVATPSGVDGFEVEFAHESGASFSSFVDGDQFEHTQVFGPSRPDGEWTVRVRAHYNSYFAGLGALGDWSDPIVVTRDATAPEVSFGAPADGFIKAWPGASGTAADASGLRSVDFEVHAVAPDGTCGALVESFEAELDGEDWSFDASPGDGVHCLRVIAVDLAGNTTTVKRFVTLDTTAPDAFDVNAPAGWVEQSTGFTWDASADAHGVIYAVFVDDGTGAVEHAVASGTSLSMVLAPGHYVWWVEARDSLGNLTSTAHTEIDVTGVLQLEAPDADALFVDDLTVTWSGALHAPGGVARFDAEFTHEGGEAFTTAVAATESELLQPFAAGRPDGEWTVRVRAVYTDLVPEFGTVNGPWTEPVTVVRDSAAPVLPALKFPANGVTQASYDLVYRWSGVAGADHYEFRTSPTSTVVGGELVDGLSTDTDDTFFEATAGADGTGWWQVRAVDEAGNASAWTAPWKLIVDHAYVAPKPPVPGNSAATGEDEETVTEPTSDSEETEPTEPTEPNQETDEPTTPTDDGTTSGAGEAEGDKPGDSGFPLLWVMIGGALVSLVGLGALIRFLFLRRA